MNAILHLIEAYTELYKADHNEEVAGQRVDGRLRVKEVVNQYAKAFVKTVATSGETTLTDVYGNTICRIINKRIWRFWKFRRATIR